MRFCQSFMTEPTATWIHRCPRGHIGVGQHEIGYMFGQYKRITNRYESVLTARACPGAARRCAQGDQVRDRVLRRRMLRSVAPFEGKRVVVPARQRRDLRDRRCTRWAASSSPARTRGLRRGRGGDRPRPRQADQARRARRIANYAERRPGAGHTSDASIWSVPCDIAAVRDPERARRGRRRDARAQRLPHRGRGREHARDARGPPLRRPCPSRRAGRERRRRCHERARDAAERPRDSWSFEHTEERLADIMSSIRDRCLETAEVRRARRLRHGANIAGFIRVADAMLALGVIELSGACRSRTAAGAGAAKAEVAFALSGAREPKGPREPSPGPPRRARGRSHQDARDRHRRRVRVVEDDDLRARPDCGRSSIRTTRAPSTPRWRCRSAGRAARPTRRHPPGRPGCLQRERLVRGQHGPAADPPTPGTAAMTQTSPPAA